MRTLIVGMGIALMLTGAAWGATQVDFSLGLKSPGDTDAYVNGWKTGGPYVAFGHGAAALGETSGLVTWDVQAAVSGTDADGPTPGLVNVVFNLTLKDAGGNPVAATYVSRINDGTLGGPIYPVVGQSNDPVEMAAFPTGWDVDLDYTILTPFPDNLDNLGPPTNPGRLYDAVGSGGPRMDRVQFPSTATHGGGRITGGAYQAGGSPSGVDSSMLLGMGIGYSQFVVATDSLDATGNAAGVGIAAPITGAWLGGVPELTWAGLGAKPIAEGQIDTSALGAGTYTLELTVPEDAEGNAIGQNVMPYLALTSTAGGYAPVPFAEKADVVTRDATTHVAASATFVVGGPSITPVTPTAWSSVRTHGTVGELPIVLSATDGTATTECRNNGIQKLVIVFDNTLTPGAGGNYTGANIGITGAGLAVSSQSLATTTLPNDTLVILLTGSVDRTCYTLNLTGVVTLAALADPTCSVLILTGDVGNNKAVSGTDVNQEKAKIAQAPGAVALANVRFDVNCDGNLSGTDSNLVKARATNSNPVVCP